MYSVIAYIKFLLNATNQHGVHSPFVYNLVTQCFYDKTTYDAYASIKRYRQQLSKCNDQIEVTDFGAGSKLMGHKRRVAQMLKHSSSSYSDSKLLFRIGRYFKFKNTLELGTSLGISAHALALGTTHKVYTIEGCPNTFAFTKKNYEALQCSTIIPINSNFKTAIANYNESSLDCVFFDGHHNKSATLMYFNMLVPKAHNDTVFIFDDIYWSKEMTEAWQHIISDQRIRVSIDLFNIGLVFFRKEQAKQNFKIRL